MTKSYVSFGFGNIYWRNPEWKTSFFVPCIEWSINLKWVKLGLNVAGPVFHSMFGLLVAFSISFLHRWKDTISTYFLDCDYLRKTQQLICFQKTYFQNLLPASSHWKHQKTLGFLIISGKLEVLTTNVPHHIETSQVICIANELTGFYMMGNIGR